MAASLIVETPSGKLRGELLRSPEAGRFFSFKGIPYARPPIARLRFRDPQPVEPWQDIRDATTHGPMCAQVDSQTQRLKGSEDCLYLNVYTRDLDGRAPVLFWIHGGAFMYGNGNDESFGPDFFLQKDVVLVTINYRLGVLGFLNLQTEEISGNQGLKDQVMALKWVQSHVRCFGGDPENVTIFGASAGAASVHYLTLSPMAKDLFHKAICQSGSALNPWALPKTPEDNLKEFSRAVNYRGKADGPLTEYLKNLEGHALVKGQEKLISPKRLMQCRFPFGPTLDYASSEPFMPANLRDAILEGVQVPLMIGWNSFEALFKLDVLRLIGMKEIEENFAEYLPSTVADDFKYKYGLGAKDLQRLYFKREAPDEKKVLEFWSDLAFVEGIHSLENIQYHQGAAPTYLYRFSYDENVTLVKKLQKIPYKGASHGDELTYLFKSRLPEINNLQQFQEGTGADRTAKQMIELWVNFAKTGRPTPFTSELLPIYWQPLISDVVLRFLDIGDELRMEKALNIEQRYYGGNKRRVSLGYLLALASADQSSNRIESN
ncbi:esterase E4-like [Trichogramma pretiosum]|uniref:esterase E4-like n=1 Tax=Trichogramma pretiosum TaxID=7493 RepID=UPI0006C950A9|nr:esterase E4-like [Trichogramma pretiosum]